MRPRWHFLALSAFAGVGTLLLVLTLLYVASLAVFFMRESGAWFVPAFGTPGWFALLRSLPWLLVLLAAAFIVLLEILVRRYSFVYQKPLVVSILGAVIIIAVGGFLIGQSPFHRGLFWHARHNELPLPFGMWYREPFREPRSAEIYHGVVISASSSGLVVADINEEGTSTVIITPQTRLPYGADFAPGDFVVVFGDDMGSDTMRAFGIREVDE